MTTLSVVAASPTVGIATAEVVVRGGPSPAPVWATSTICAAYHAAPGVAARLRERTGSPALYATAPTADPARLHFDVLNEDAEWMATELAGLLEFVASRCMCSHAHRRSRLWRWLLRLFRRP
jgi:hypothetical protein